MKIKYYVFYESSTLSIKIEWILKLKKLKVQSLLDYLQNDLNLIVEYKFPSGNLIIPLFLLNNQLEQIVEKNDFFLSFHRHIHQSLLLLFFQKRSGQKTGMALKIK